MIALLPAILLAPSGTMPQAEYLAPRNWEEDASLPIKGTSVPQDRVALVVDLTGAVSLREEVEPMLALVNGSRSGLKFTSCDGCLPLYREAKDASGRWRPIEWLAISECGNSYDSPSLKPGRMWMWPVALNSGSFKTQVRFSLKAGGKTLKSNAYQDSIDPQMFQLEEGLRGSKFIKVGG